MAVAKSADAFRTISEAATELDVPQHVLRHWEEAFGQIRPMRRAGGRRYYRPVDLDVLRGVRVLLYDERYTTKGVQKIFKENGVKYVAEIGRATAEGKPVELRPKLADDADTDQPEDIAAASPDDTMDVLDLGKVGTKTVIAPPAVTVDQLKTLLARLEAVESALDEANLAIEAIAEVTRSEKS